MIFISIIIGIVATEAVIKQVREQNGVLGEKIPFFKGKLYLTKYHNYGAFLNFLQNRQEFVKGLSVSLCLICTMVFVCSMGRKGKGLLKTGLSVLLGGAYSNTYDRLVRGYVVDYFGFLAKNERLRNVVFNISDFCIMIGALLCVLKM